MRSPPAVSQQIKVLEGYLGVSLFDRSTKRPRLTDAGRFYYEHAKSIIQSHTQAYQAFEKKYRHPILQLNAPTYIAQELLIPGYKEFRHFASPVELRLVASNTYVDFENEASDAAIRFGTGDWPELDCRFITDVEPIIVCGKQYIESNGLDASVLLTEQQLSALNALTLSDQLSDWKELLPGISFKSSTVFDSYFSVMKAAEENIGAAVGLMPLVNKALQQGKLVQLKTRRMTTDHAYWLVSPYNRANPDNVDALASWVGFLFEKIK